MNTLLSPAQVPLKFRFHSDGDSEANGYVLYIPEVGWKVTENGGRGMTTIILSGTRAAIRSTKGQEECFFDSSTRTTLPWIMFPWVNGFLVGQGIAAEWGLDPRQPLAVDDFGQCEFCIVNLEVPSRIAWCTGDLARGCITSFSEEATVHTMLWEEPVLEDLQELRSAVSIMAAS